MPAGWLQVREWRYRADRLRQAAEEMDIPSARDGLIRAAESYERMASELEQQLNQQANQPLAT
jgi:hypothetical protein